MNFKVLFSSVKRFDEKVRLVLKPWADADSKTNITLGGCSTADVRAGRVYAEWISFTMRLYDGVPMYYRFQLTIEVLGPRNVYRIKRGLPLLNGLRTQDVEILNFAERESLLMERALWQSRWDNSENGKVTFDFIRDISFVENHPRLRFRLHVGSERIFV